MKALKTFFLITGITILSSFDSVRKIEQSTFDQNIETVEIGGQSWTKTNLSVVKFRNGDFILHAKSKEQWIKAENEQIPAYCYYENGSENQSMLYNFYAVTDARMLAPNGYHIPSKSEWDKMIEYLGGKEIAGLKLKSTSGWKNKEDKSFNGSNESGFNAKAIGTRSADYKYGGGGEYSGQGESCVFWTSTIDDDSYSDGNQSFAIGLDNFSHEVAGFPYSYYMGCGFSVRCIKD